MIDVKICSITTIPKANRHNTQVSRLFSIDPNALTSGLTSVKAREDTASSQAKSNNAINPSQHTFLPFVMDTNGTFGPRAADFLLRLAKLQARKKTNAEILMRHHGTEKAYAGFLAHQWRSILSFVCQRLTAKSIQYGINHHLDLSSNSCYEQDATHVWSNHRW